MTKDASAGRRLAVVVLAAGRGTRLAVGADAPPKVLLECLGAPLLEHVRRALEGLGADLTLVVVGHQAAQVRAYLDQRWKGARPILQEPQNGTGHALRLAMDALPRFDGDVLVVSGDVPQVTRAALARLLTTHRSLSAAATFLTGSLPDAGSLGRVVRGPDGRFEAIVEARDAADRPAILALPEFNTGLYAFRADALRSALAGVASEQALPQQVSPQQGARRNAQGEEYLTDALGRIRAAGGLVEALCVPEGATLLGVNTWEDLALAFAVLRRRILGEHLAQRVEIVDLEHTIVEVDVVIEPGARLLPFTYVQTGCRIAAGAVVGPFARLRGAAVLEAEAEVGNFVEVKASTLGRGVKAKHLAYLGDATVGAEANIGCGAITANFDGAKKHRTEIGARARIGAGSVLVAPVQIGERAVTGANSVVTARRNVAPGQVVVGVPARPLGAGRVPKMSPSAPAPETGPKAAQAAAASAARRGAAQRAGRGGRRGKREAHGAEAARRQAEGAREGGASPANQPRRQDREGRGS